MKMSKILLYTMSILSIIPISCDQAHTPAENNLMMATLYNYFAAEYDALAYQAFNIGMERLQEIHDQHQDVQNMAVVVDIDETILDNSPYEAKLILNNQSYSAGSWNTWCDLANANAVPGALDFLNLADSLGFKVFYVSNRKEQSALFSTMENLRSIGFPQVEEKNFLLRVDESSKKNRRKAIEDNYEIVLLAGDNLGDFYEDSTDIAARDQLMQKNRAAFGNRFIVLPNAMYGEWVTALGKQNNNQVFDSLLMLMVARHYHLPKR